MIFLKNQMSADDPYDIRKRTKWRSLMGLHTKRIICKNEVTLQTIGSNETTALTNQELRNGCRMGIDTHADTSCAGKHVRIMERIDGAQYNVAPFHPDYAPVERVTMINGAIAVDREDGMDGYILQLNNFLDFTKTMDHSLLCPMQARVNGVKIDDVPRHLDSSSTQSVSFDSIDYNIPIHYHGPIPFFHIRYPTDEDLDNLQWLELTSTGAWEPYKENFSISNIITQNDPLSDNDLYTQINNSVIISGISCRGKEGTLTPETISKLFHVPLELAKRTLQVTTHTSLREHHGKLSRRLRTDTYQRRYKRLGGPYARFYMDIFFPKVKSITGHTCAVIFSNRIGFSKVYPLETRSQAHEALTSFIQEVGIPHELHSDGGKELIKGMMRKKVKRYEIRTTMSEPYSPWQNDAEREIKLNKLLTRYLMQSTNTPIRLWNFCSIHASEIRTILSSNKVGMNHRTPFEVTYGFTPDISELTSYAWYQWIWYWDPTDFQTQKLGRWCGVASNIGSGHTYNVLKSNGEIITRSTISTLSDDDNNSEAINQKKDEFTKSIKAILGDYEKALPSEDHEIDPGNPYSSSLGEIDDTDIDHDTTQFYETANDGDGGIPEADQPEYNESISTELSDRLIGLRVLLPRGGEYNEGKVISRKRTSDGKQLQGRSNPNPLLDTSVYEIEFPDGGVEEFATNTIIESLYDSIDGNARSSSFITGVIDHRKDDTALSNDESLVKLNDHVKRVATTKGWELKVQWLDGTSNWLPLKDVKQSNPLEVAEYAISRDLEKEPAFKWWVGNIIRTRRRCISRLKATRRCKDGLKYGIEVPNSIEEAEELDRKYGNDLWKKAIQKELDKVRIAFALIPDTDNPPIGSKEIPYHLVFDVKADLTRKARLVAGGHKNKNVPKHMTYCSVVSRESVRICLTLAALNGLDILSGDVGNAYLNAKPLERCHVVIKDTFMFGPAAVGKKAIICRALYGMKSSGNAWRQHLSNVLDKELGFSQCYADNDVWMKPGTKEDGKKFYHYVCIYVDDLLIISNKTNEIMKSLQEHFLIKKESIGEPKTYLGSDLRKYVNQAGEITYWNIGSNTYVREATRIVDNLLNKSGIRVSGKGNQPFSALNYRPELDVSPFCNHEQHTIFQNLIGMLRWIVELGRIDVNLETSLLSSYLASPRIGHLHQALHIFHYLKNHNSSWIPMDPMKLDIEYKGPEEFSPESRRKSMKVIYREAMEELPENMPEARGESVQLNVYVDADHAGNKVTRRSQTGILVFLNMAPIYWYSKRQNTVETSTFSSEYVALKICAEKIIALRYKLRMLGVPLEGPANTFCDNESTVKSTVRPEARLNKKNVSIAYHKCRECFAAGVMNLYFEFSEDNLADFLTKVLPVIKRKRIFSHIFA